MPHEIRRLIRCFASRLRENGEKGAENDLAGEQTLILAWIFLVLRIVSVSDSRHRGA